MLRRITNEELADLPEKWENPKVDTNKYWQCVLIAWECGKQQYKNHKMRGGLCQRHKNKYYVA